jgi:hypothetical protein
VDHCVERSNDRLLRAIAKMNTKHKASETQCSAACPQWAEIISSARIKMLKK